MLGTEANLHEHQRPKKKKKKKRNKKEESCLLQICSLSTMSFEESDTKLPGSPETGEEEGGKLRKKKHKRSKVKNMGDITLVLSDGEMVEEQRRGKKERRQQKQKGEDAIRLVSKKDGEPRKKKRKREETDVSENNLEVPDGKKMAVKLESAREMERWQAEVVEHDVPVGAEIKGERRKKKKKRRKQDEMEANDVEGAITTSLDKGVETETSDGNCEKSRRKHKHKRNRGNPDGEVTSAASAVEKPVRDTSDDVLHHATSGEVNPENSYTQDYMEELREFFPDVDKMSADFLSRVLKYDLDRMKKFKKIGVSFRRGRFTAEENDRLLKNVKDFLCLTGIDRGSKLFFSRRYPEEIKHIEQIKRQHEFPICISEGIPRHWCDIYARGRKLFDEFHYKGRFTNEELKDLQKFHTLYGNNWMKISQLTGRSNLSLEKRFSQLADKKGSWTECEEKELMKIVKEYMLTQVEVGQSEPIIRKEKLYNNVPWKNVACHLKTRNWVQCRVKWMSILTKKMTFGEVVYKGKKSLKAKINMIKALYEMNVEDEAEVKWENLTDIIGNVPPAYIQAKFYKLKVTQVPGWQKMAFSDIVDFLYSNVKPAFENSLKDCEDDESQATREVFRFSEIFDDV